MDLIQDKVLHSIIIFSALFVGGFALKCTDHNTLSLLSFLMSLGSLFYVFKTVKEDWKK